MAMLLAGCDVVVNSSERLVNRVDLTSPGVSAPADVAFHQKLFVADLHADTLLWDRDVFARVNFGHLDVPRLRDGNVSLQVFGVVTKTPPPRQISVGPITHCYSGDDPNLTSLLTALELRPIRTWFDLEARALDQADRLRRFELRSRVESAAGGQRLRILRTAADLALLMREWRRGELDIGIMLDLEGAHWLGDASTTDEAQAGAQRLFDAGFRMIALTHYFDNGLAGSSEGCMRSGLTQLGRAVIEKAEQLGMIVDLAHLSSHALQEAAAVATSPVVVSHTGVQGACRPPCYPPRNLTDADIQAVARTGGTIGIGYWHDAVGKGLDSIVKAIAYTVSVLNRPAFVAERQRVNPEYDPFDHIALGSDFDGFVTTPIDSSQLALLTAELRHHANAGRLKFTDKQIKKIVGGNVCRVFAQRLPGGSSSAASSICQVAMH